MAFLSFLVGCLFLKLKLNLNTVAQTATNAEIGTASAMSISKNISMIGMLLPAPERPPAFDRAIKRIMRTVPILSIRGFSKGTLTSTTSVVPSSSSTTGSS